MPIKNAANTVLWYIFSDGYTPEQAMLRCQQYYSLNDSCWEQVRSLVNDALIQEAN